MTEQERQKILCIEDEGDILDLLRIILERDGFECISALGGLEGLQKARSVQPDLILLDLMMPDMNGWEVLRQLQEDERLRYIPVLILTVRDRYSEPDIHQKIGDMATLMTKPFEFMSLTQRIRSLLAMPASEVKWIEPAKQNF